VLFARLTVEDSAKYLAGIKTMIQKSNELVERSKSDIKLVYEIAPATVEGAKGIEVTCDLDKATGDGDQHIWQTILTTVFGIDHKLSIFLVAPDDKHVFIGMESSDKLAEIVKDFSKNETGLAESAPAQKALVLSDDEADWVSLLNPGGLVEFAKTAMKSMMILGGFPDFPDYPAAPPLALTMQGSDTIWQGELILPVEAAQAMSEYSKEIEKIFGQ
jgi:hypothetical protein